MCVWVVQPDNDHAFVLTVPDEKLCKQAVLIAARVLAVARLLRISCVWVCVLACFSECSGQLVGPYFAGAPCLDITRPASPDLACVDMATFYITTFYVTLHYLTVLQCT